MIRQEDKACYDVFGVFVIRGALSPSQLQVVDREVEEITVQDRGGLPFDGKERQVTENVYDRRPKLRAVMEEVGMPCAVDVFLGPGSYGFSGVANLFVGDTSWHPDLGWTAQIPLSRNDPGFPEQAPGHYHPGVTVAFYLDLLSADSGCLRVIPGSHRSPFYEQLWSLHKNIPKCLSTHSQLLEIWKRDGGDRQRAEQFLTDPEVNRSGLKTRNISCLPIETQPGDAVFFSHQIWHSTFGGRAGCRMLTTGGKVKTY